VQLSARVTGAKTSAGRWKVKKSPMKLACHRYDKCWNPCQSNAQHWPQHMHKSRQRPSQVMLIDGMRMRADMRRGRQLRTVCTALPSLLAVPSNPNVKHKVQRREPPSPDSPLRRESEASEDSRGKHGTLSQKVSWAATSRKC
jgi:hypothetical protein